MMSSNGKTGAALVLVQFSTWLVGGVVAQQSAFQWGFNDWTSKTLPQCQPLKLFVNEQVGTVKPAPPYYLAAYEVGGLSTMTYVGNNKDSLSWTVNHPVGSNLVLNMVDSNGNSGGVLTDLYSIAGDKTGANASCISTSSPLITVTSNATDKINTCDSVQLKVTGGKKPYSVTILETNAENPFNNTMGEKDDSYLWVDNLTPGNKVLIAISDEDGNYGLSTQLMTLTGSSNTRCSISSKSFSSTEGDGGKDDDSKGSSKTGIIAGIVIALFFLVFFGLLAWFFIRRRNKKSEGVREGRKGWTIDRSESIKHSGGRARLPSDPNESDITPFTMPRGGEQTSPHMSVHGYSDPQISPFDPDGTRSSNNSNARTTYYREDEQDAYAMDAFRTSGYESNFGVNPSQIQSQSRSQESQSSGSRGFRVVNDEGEYRNYRETKAPGAVNQSAQQPRQVFQHQDAGVSGLEEIPPAYPGPGSGFNESSGGR